MLNEFNFQETSPLKELTNGFLVELKKDVAIYELRNAIYTWSDTSNGINCSINWGHIKGTKLIQLTDISPAIEVYFEYNGERDIMKNTLELRKPKFYISGPEVDESLLLYLRERFSQTE